MYNDKLDGVISHEFWLDRHNKIQEEIASLDKTIYRLKNDNIREDFEKGVNLLELPSE